MCCSRAEIRAQLVLAVQVDVERADVEEREIEEFSRRKVDVGEEVSGDSVLGVAVEIAEKTLDADAAVPAHDVRRNLVSEREGRGSRDDPPARATLAAMSRRIDRRSCRSSRNATCCDQGSPTMTRRPFARGFVEEARGAAACRCGRH